MIGTMNEKKSKKDGRVRMKDIKRKYKIEEKYQRDLKKKRSCSSYINYKKRKNKIERGKKRKNEEVRVVQVDEP